MMASENRPPLNDAIAISMAKLVDDSQVDSREPTHSDIEDVVKRAGLQKADPRRRGSVVGKAKRVRSVLMWAIEHDITAGERLVHQLLSLLRAVGGFRPESLNYAGREAIDNLTAVLRKDGYILHSDGEVSGIVFDDLGGIEKHEVLQSYAKRAMRGADDAALLVGTGKDLLEAVAIYVLQQKRGSYSEQHRFPMLLGLAFTELGLTASGTVRKPNESAQTGIERALYELACSVNRLRNKEGTGHGRPFPSTVSQDEARTAIVAMGLIAQYLLAKLDASL